jgi:hypothetical protein
MICYAMPRYVKTKDHTTHINVLAGHRAGRQRPNPLVERSALLHLRSADDKFAAWCESVNLAKTDQRDAQRAAEDRENASNRIVACAVALFPEPVPAPDFHSCACVLATHTARLRSAE